MSLEEVTMYRLICDGCGKSAQDGDYWAWAQPEGATEEASESDWEFIGEKHYCRDCVVWDEEADELVPKITADATTEPT